MQAIKGNFLNPIDKDNFTLLDNYCLVIDNKGLINDLLPYDSYILNYPDLSLVDYSQYIFTPGFIDLHTHLPQADAIGIGKGELLDWLNTYIFPLENKFINKDFARGKSELFFQNLLQNGTTTACIYSATNKMATEIAFQEASKSGIRAYIGNSLMDSNVPDYFIEDNLNYKEGMNYFLKNYHSNGKLKYIVTPRFAGSCSMEMMKYSSEFANSNDLFIQTHLSENRNELAFIKRLFSAFENYTDIYYKAGLLSEKSILAHAIYLDQREIELLSSHQCSIAHCPCSNRFLVSGLMPLREYLEQDLRIGLGTDVAGGFSYSIINEMKETIETSKTRAIINNDNTLIISNSEAFYLATLGAASVLNEDREKGSFEIGKVADFVIIEIDGFASSFNSFEETLSQLIYKQSKVLYTFIQGNKVYSFN